MHVKYINISNSFLFSDNKNVNTNNAKKDVQNKIQY